MGGKNRFLKSDKCRRAWCFEKVCWKENALLPMASANCPTPKWRHSEPVINYSGWIGCNDYLNQNFKRKETDGWVDSETDKQIPEKFRWEREGGRETDVEVARQACWGGGEGGGRRGQRQRQRYKREKNPVKTPDIHPLTGSHSCTFGTYVGNSRSTFDIAD